jgi:hypothetical protein
MDQEYVNRVEAYFRDELTEAEILQFNQDLKNDPELEQMYQEYQLAMDAVDIQVEDELRAQFEAWENEGEVGGKERRIFPQLLKVAASLTLLVSTLYYFLIYNQVPLSGQELAQDFYQLPESPGASKGAEEAIWAEGLSFYEAGEYQESINLWEKLEQPNNEQKYFLAHAYFNLERYHESITLLTPIAGGTDSYSYLADWSLVLAYLAANEQDAFQVEIQKITDDKSHPFHDKALKLQKKADKMFRKLQK